jgi:hypothetical protein
MAIEDRHDESFIAAMPNCCQSAGLLNLQVEKYGPGKFRRGSVAYDLIFSSLV